MAFRGVGCPSIGPHYAKCYKPDSTYFINQKYVVLYTLFYGIEGCKGVPQLAPIVPSVPAPVIMQMQDLAV